MHSGQPLVSTCLPSEKSQCVRETFFSEDTHSEDMYVKNRRNIGSQNILYIHSMGAVTLGSTDHPNS